MKTLADVAVIKNELQQKLNQLDQLLKPNPNDSEEIIRQKVDYIYDNYHDALKEININIKTIIDDIKAIDLYTSVTDEQINKFNEQYDLDVAEKNLNHVNKENLDYYDESDQSFMTLENDLYDIDNPGKITLYEVTPKNTNITRFYTKQELKTFVSKL